MEDVDIDDYFMSWLLIIGNNLEEKKNVRQKRLFFQFRIILI